MPISPERFHQAVAKFATGVTVISSLEASGDIHGMTANSLASVSLEPRLVLVSIGHQRDTYANIRERGRFGVSILAQGQEVIARYFAREEKAQGEAPQVPWRLEKGGSPRLEGALVFMECRVVAHHTYGDHTIFIAEAEDVAVRQGQPLLFYDGQIVDPDTHPLS